MLSPKPDPCPISGDFRVLGKGVLEHCGCLKILTRVSWLPGSENPSAAYTIYVGLADVWS
jgi:hypothetical protein